MSDLSAEAENFSWLLRNFAGNTLGVSEAIAVSADGLLLACSDESRRDMAEQFSAIASGLSSLTQGASFCFDMAGVDQVIVEMGRGFMFIMSISDGSVLGVLAEKSCDVGLVGYEMALLVDRVGRVLTPELVVELQNSVVA